MEILRSESTGIAYTVRGDEPGPVVLCLHGFPDIPRTWDRLADALAGDGFRVVLPWLPGYAPSTLDGPLDPLSVAGRFFELLDELSTEPVRFVGHDWGAVIGYALLAGRPDRFQAAALLSIPHPFVMEHNLPDHPKQILRSSYMAAFQLPVLPERLIRARKLALVKRLWKVWSPGFDPGRAYFEELDQCLEQSLPAPLSYYRALRSPKFFREFRARLERDPIPVPTLYLHGERDGCISVEMAKGQGRQFSALFEMLRLAEAGHFVHLERPAVVNPAIRTWFASH